MSGPHEHRHGIIGALSTKPAVYAAWQRLVSNDYEAIRHRLDRFLAPGKTYLDLGCGTGTFFPTVSGRGSRYVGIDVDPEMIAYARHRHPAGEFHAMDARSIRALPQRFDRVFSVGLLHHMSDSEITDLLRAVPEVLVPQGRYLVIDAVPPRDRSNVVGALLRRLDNGAYVRTSSDYERLLERYLFIERHETFGRFPLDYAAFELRGPAE